MFADDTDDTDGGVPTKSEIRVPGQAPEDSASGPPRGAHAGRMMGGYRLYRRIGGGGMASVYIGHKAGPGGFAQFSAIKVVHPHLATERDYVEMFLDEARIAAMINHVNVCRVFDFGRAESTYYLAMEHLLGETWFEVRRRIIRGGDPDERRRLPLLAAWMASQACEGLHAAHEARDVHGRPLNIVHRDVSPQNLFVTFDGGLRVLDFGIASAAERLHTTRTGAVKGRYAYMSPEQMRARSLDRRSDIWALGVVLWEGLAGRSLFRRPNDAATMAAVVEDEIPPLPADVPAALGAVAHRALRRDPDERFATAREMGAAIADALADLPAVTSVDVSNQMHEMFAASFAVQQNLRKAAALESDPNTAEDSVSISLVEARAARSSRPAARRSAAPRSSSAPRRPSSPLMKVGGVLAAVVLAVLATLVFAGRSSRQEAISRMRESHPELSEEAILARVRQEARALAEKMAAQAEARVRAEVEAEAAAAAKALEQARAEKRALEEERARAEERARERRRRRAERRARRAAEQALAAGTQGDEPNTRDEEAEEPPPEPQGEQPPSGAAQPPAAVEEAASAQDQAW